MEKKYAYLIFLGMLIGAAFGIFLGASSENRILPIGLGALIGTGIGWFIAAAAQELQKKGKGGD